MVLDEIAHFLSDYFEALYTQDLPIFDRVFHPNSTLYSQQDGETVIRPFAEYREMVVNRSSPASRGQPRSETVLMVDMLSDSMAVARVRLRLFDNIMEDHLNLVRTAEGWRIVAKTFTRVGPA
ncbi:MAG TPA: nuclear transport factor 2 family protein [Azospirillaceae bacterium]|nr:nuclear transport factor 2 family protein [Azospirillaceae bacterium]